MRYIRTNELQPGMISVRTLFDKNGTKLLAANTQLSGNLIKKLSSNGYSGIFIFDEYSDYENMKTIFSEEERYEAIASLQSLNIDKVLFFSNSIVDKIMHMEDIVIEMKDLQGFHDTTYEHSLNVAQLAVPCGIGMGLNNNQLVNLAAGAMLHDIGKIGISKEILDKPGKLTKDEFEIIKTHPQIGYDMLYDNQLIHPETRAGVLLHHENEDGSGYPFGYSYDQTPIIPKIIHVADVYDALRQKRSYKEKFSYSDAIEYLMGGCGTIFNYDVVLTFIKYLTVYPVGTDVLLSTGDVARVLKNHATNVLRPTVICKENKRILDLSKDEKTYNITITSNIPP